MKIEHLFKKLSLYVRRCLDAIVRVALGGTPPDAISLDSVNFLQNEYDIEYIGIGLKGVPNQLHVEAMDTLFVVEPFRGEPDWELLELKLERYKRGYRRDICRIYLEGDN